MPHLNGKKQAKENEKKGKELKRRYYILYVLMLAIAVFAVSCTDNLDITIDSPESDKGEIVMFRSGTHNPSASRATATYMPENSRFVCRMYFISQLGMNEYDISNPTDAWLKVNNSTGNSVYRKPDFNEEGMTNDGRGNDMYASTFYWRNRRSHAFLAWTDMNRMKNSDYKYSANSESLKFSPYDEVVTTNEKKDVWIDTGYHLYGVKDDANTSQDREFISWDMLKKYVEEHGDSEEFKNAQSGFSGTEKYTGSYYYEYGWSCKYFVSENVSEAVSEDGKKKTSAWIKYLMYYDKYEYVPTGSEEKVLDENNILTFLKDSFGNYVAAVEYDENDENHEHPHYYKTDINGNIRYNEEKPRYTFYMKRISKKIENAEVQSNYRANVFDLTRKPQKDSEGNILTDENGKLLYSVSNMSQQPDVILALVKKEPTSGTLEANRIDLYFKHQFSQIQVNLMNSKDNSVSINKEQIEKVELLGVSEKGYVFTELLKNGEMRPTGYKDVVASDYTTEHLKKNPFGTSFEMFERKVPEDEQQAKKPIKSFEAISFGLLQAIRITWHETDEEGRTEHVSTFRVDNDMRTLESGKKYIWDMELRRGTLAVIRIDITPWILNEKEYNTDGSVNTGGN